MDGLGEAVGDGEMVEEVIAGAHPLIKTPGQASTRNIDPTGFFILFSLLFSAIQPIIRIGQWYLARLIQPGYLLFGHCPPRRAQIIF